MYLYIAFKMYKGLFVFLVSLVYFGVLTFERFNYEAHEIDKRFDELERDMDCTGEVEELQTMVKELEERLDALEQLCQP